MGYIYVESSDDSISAFCTFLWVWINYNDVPKTVDILLATIFYTDIHVSGHCIDCSGMEYNPRLLVFVILCYRLYVIA